MLKTPIITLTTDFGLKDPFAGLMKGVILSINPDVTIIDITHDIQRHNIFEASQVLAMSYTYFPPATINIAVVDPGVGSTRRPILVVTENQYFIGPDNGIFSAVMEEENADFLTVYHLTSPHYFLPVKGSTFHGRDIFAPVAAWLSKGVDSRKFGAQINDYAKIPVPKPEISGNSITGEIVSVDNFGNAISNIKRDDIEKVAPPESGGTLKVVYSNNELPVVSFYSQDKSPDLSAVINSFGHLELFVYLHSAAEKFNINRGDKIFVTII